jgi:hypothetical protein
MEYIHSNASWEGHCSVLTWDTMEYIHSNASWEGHCSVLTWDTMEYIHSNVSWEEHCSVLTWETNGPILFFSLRILPRPFSMTEGKDNNLRVCPVGAVSKTTQEKFIPFTSLKKKSTT